MKRQSQETLRQELLAAGARDSEVDELVLLAAGISRLGRSAAVSDRKRRVWWPIIVPVGLTGIAAGMAIVVAAQAVMPSSWLYPVQKVSDSVAVAVHPEYRAEVMMRHAQQVRQLVAVHASTKVVTATLADYQTEAAAYKSSSANYAAFEYCKTNLQQASAGTSGTERAAIDDTLRSLNSV